MARIEISSEKISEMYGLTDNVKKSVVDYKSEMEAIRRQTLGISRSVCNLDDVLESVEASVKLQDEKIESLDRLNADLKEFESEVVRIDGRVAAHIRQSQNEFYEANPWLRPEYMVKREKEWRKRSGSFQDWCEARLEDLLEFGQGLIGKKHKVQLIDWDRDFDRARHDGVKSKRKQEPAQTAGVAGVLDGAFARAFIEAWLSTQTAGVARVLDEALAGDSILRETDGDGIPWEWELEGSAVGQDGNADETVLPEAWRVNLASGARYVDDPVKNPFGLPMYSGPTMKQTFVEVNLEKELKAENNEKFWENARFGGQVITMDSTTKARYIYWYIHPEKSPDQVEGEKEAKIIYETYNKDNHGSADVGT